MFPILLIAIGVLVLLFGNRLAILGAAVGALLGVVLLRLFSGSSDLLFQFLLVGGLALAGFFLAAFARGVIEIIILVIGALGGAAIVLGILDLFTIDLGLVNWLLALAGGVVGLFLIRRARRGDRDWGMIILASLVGGLLVTRGITQLLTSLQETWMATLILIVTVGAGIAYQGGIVQKRRADQAVAAPPPVKNEPPAPPSP
jgi:hypothetical protein